MKGRKKKSRKRKRSDVDWRKTKRRQVEAVADQPESNLKIAFRTLKDGYNGLLLILLFVEGRHVKILGPDAEVVANELNLTLCDAITPVAKFEVSKLQTNLHILVARGHMVGIVRNIPNLNADDQLLKSRKVTGIYTRSMFIGADTFSLNKNHRVAKDVACCRSWNNNLVVIHESPSSGSSRSSNLGDQCRKTITVLAVCAISGRARYRSIDQRGTTIESQQIQLHALLERLDPFEIVVARSGQSISDLTMATVNRMTAKRSYTGLPDEEQIRVTKIDERFFDDGEMGDIQNMDVPLLVVPCLRAMQRYAALFDLDELVQLIEESDGLAQIVLDDDVLEIDSTTARHLELIRLESTGQYEGSLLWDIGKHVNTVFGFRMLRHWLRHPPSLRSTTKDRFRTVRYFRHLFAASHPSITSLSRVLSQFLSRLPDLQAGLACFAYRKKCTVPIYVGTVTSLIQTREFFREVLPRFVDQIDAPLPRSAKLCLEGILDCLIGAEDLLSSLNVAKKNVYSLNPSDIFSDINAHPSMAEIEDEIKRIRARLNDLMNAEIYGHSNDNNNIRTEFQGPEYLVKFPSINGVPADWIVICRRSRGKVFVRSPEMNRLVRDLRIQQARLEKEGQLEWNRHLEQFRTSHHARLMSAVRKLARLDCLMALAVWSLENGLNYQPVILNHLTETPAPSFLRVTSCHNTVVTKLLEAFNSTDENIVVLEKEIWKTESIDRAIICGDPVSRRFYMRSIGVYVVLAQIGSYLRAISVEFVHFKSLTIRLTNSDHEQPLVPAGENLVTLGIINSGLARRCSMMLLDDDYFQSLISNEQKPPNEGQLKLICQRTYVCDILPVPRSDLARHLRAIRKSTASFLIGHLS